MRKYSKLVQDYAAREGQTYGDAHDELKQIGADFDNVSEFLEEIGLEPDYVIDAMEFVC